MHLREFNHETILSSSPRLINPNYGKSKVIKILALQQLIMILAAVLFNYITSTDCWKDDVINGNQKMLFSIETWYLANK